MGMLWQRMGLDNPASGRDEQPHSFYGDGQYAHILRRRAVFARLATSADEASGRAASLVSLDRASGAASRPASPATGRHERCLPRPRCWRNKQQIDMAHTPSSRADDATFRRTRAEHGLQRPVRPHPCRT